jgi:anaerobic magnesium-protoporphyrin IX monomethyl ester cyclase
MKRAGCRLIHFGVESGSQRIAEMTKKRVTIARQIEGVKLAQRVGLEVLCFFLLGYPGETEDEMRSTIGLARQLAPTYASFHRISPYPGTPLYDQFAAGSKELFPAFAGSEEDRRRVDRLIREAIWSYYCRPGYVFSRLIGTSPASWWRQLRLFAGYFLKV